MGALLVALSLSAFSSACAAIGDIGNLGIDASSLDLRDIWAITVDGSGNTYFAFDRSTDLFDIPSIGRMSSTGDLTVPLTGLSFASDVHATAGGDLYVADQSANSILKLAADSASAAV